MRGKVLSNENVECDPCNDVPRKPQTSKDNIPPTSLNSNVFDNSWEPKMSLSLSHCVYVTLKAIVCHAIICQMLRLVLGTC